jgi:hypothetical protein
MTVLENLRNAAISLIAVIMVLSSSVHGSRGRPTYCRARIRVNPVEC